MKAVAISLRERFNTWMDRTCGYQAVRLFQRPRVEPFSDGHLARDKTLLVQKAVLLGQGFQQLVVHARGQVFCEMCAKDFFHQLFGVATLGRHNPCGFARVAARTPARNRCVTACNN